LQEADAADVTQDVLRAVALAIRRFEYDPSRGTFRSWLRAVVRSKVARFLDRQHRNPGNPCNLGQTTSLDDAAAELPSVSDDSADEWDREYRRHLFDWAAGKVRREVRPATWDAFWMTAVEDRPAAEVASRLGLSIGGVYVARSRVTSRLHEWITSVSGNDGFTGSSPPISRESVMPQP